MPEQRWGDLPIMPGNESGIAAIEREQITRQITKPRPVEITGATLHQSTKTEPTTFLTPEECAIDPLTLHTIQLIQYSKRLRSLIQDTTVVKSEIDSSVLLSGIPPLPPGALVDRKPGQIHDLNRQSDFVSGKSITPSPISTQSARQLLTKSVAAICAHAGLDSTSESVLDTLSDIAHEHFLRITSLLRVAVDREALTGSSGFVDVMEQVFHEIGLGSVTTLHDFYQTRIVQYHQHILRICQQLETEYERVKIPNKKTSVDVKSVKIKEEPVSDIQFPTTEEIEATGESPQELLEELHGALQTMEKVGSALKDEETAMKWIKKEEPSTTGTDDEIINVSDSPEPNLNEEIKSIPSVSISETMSPASMDQLNKPPKKKKKKV